MALSRGDVTYVYNNYLGRNPDENDYKNLVGQDIARSALTDTVKQSDEYKSLTPEDQITLQFQNILGRPPSESELGKVMATDQFFDYGRGPMGASSGERTGFNSELFRHQLSQLPEANLVRVFKNYLGRMPDEEAYRNYLKPLERQFETTGIATPKNLAETVVDVNYDFAMDPKRLEEVGWSPEAQEYINRQFDEQARAYAAEKGIELPEDFSSLAQLRNPWQDNRAGLEGLNLMTPVGYDAKPMGLGEQPSGFDMYSDSERYELPVYAMWNTQAGTAAFSNEEKAREMAQKWGPQAAVDAYAKNPADFMKQAAAGVYVNNWVEQNMDPAVTQSGGNADKLAGLGQKYQDLSRRAVELGANPDDIAQYTSDRVGQVADTYAGYKQDTTPMGFGEFLLLAGSLYLGSMALSSFLGSAGATAGASAGAGAGAGTSVGGGFVGGGYGSIGPAGFTSAAAPAYAGTSIPTNIFSTPTMPGYVSPGAASVSGAPGYAGTTIPTNIFSTPTFPGSPTAGPSSVSIPSYSSQGIFSKPTMPISGGGGPTFKTGPSFFDDIISTGKDVLGKVNKVTGPLQDIANLTDVLTGNKQQTQGKTGVPIYRNPAELFPVSNTMMSPEEILARQTTRPTFVGGLNAIRG